MNHVTEKPDCDYTKEIKIRYESLKAEKLYLHARNIAQELGVSEGELQASRVGDGATRLIDDAEKILKGLLPLGELMALTRNESCVHERKGVYDNLKFSKHGKMKIGIFANPDIDIRLFMNHWKYNFAVAEQTHSGLRKSFQFFDKEGQAIHKTYLTPKSNESVYDMLADELKHSQQDTFIEIESYEPEPADRPDSEIDWPSFRTAWESLKSTHDFHPMLSKFKVGREQSFKKIGRYFAFRVGNSAARRALELARDRKCEVMVFAGNRGCLQIHTGPVKKLIEHNQWYNVLDEMFNLHLQEERIARTWVTKKPTRDGTVTALEIFDKDSEIIATFFGKRKPGIPELELWREIIADLPPEEVTHAT